MQGKEFIEMVELPCKRRVLPPPLDTAVAELYRIYVTNGPKLQGQSARVQNAFFDDDPGKLRASGGGLVSFRELGRGR